MSVQVQEGVAEIEKINTLYAMHELGYNILSREGELDTAKKDGLGKIPIQVVLVNQPIKEAKEELGETYKEFKKIIREEILQENPDIGPIELRMRTREASEDLLVHLETIYEEFKGVRSACMQLSK